MEADVIDFTVRAMEPEDVGYVAGILPMKIREKMGDLRKLKEALVSHPDPKYPPLFGALVIGPDGGVTGCVFFQLCFSLQPTHVFFIVNKFYVRPDSGEKEETTRLLLAHLLKAMRELNVWRLEVADDDEDNCHVHLERLLGPHFYRCDTGTISAVAVIRRSDLGLLSGDLISVPLRY